MRNNRALWRGVAGFGEAIGLAGGITLGVGACLPWATFALFGWPVLLPGLFFGGAITAGVGLAGLALVRRAPLLAVVCGLAGFALSVTAADRVGAAVVGGILRIERSLSPVNSRLAQIGLPPIDPAPGIGPRRDYVGPGILWSVLGGEALTLGAGLRLAAGRRSRACTDCGFVWPERRARVIHFCPRCGHAAGPASALVCPSCHQLRERRDLYCATCGASAAVPRT
jgi:hypothetical protein